MDFYWNQRKENGDLWEENDKIKKAYASLKAVRISRLFFHFFPDMTIFKLKIYKKSIKRMMPNN